MTALTQNDNKVPGIKVPLQQNQSNGMIWCVYSLLSVHELHLREKTIAASKITIVLPHFRPMLPNVYKPAICLIGLSQMDVRSVHPHFAKSTGTRKMLQREAIHHALRSLTI